MRYPSIIILGAPGSGKGTQGKALDALPEFFHCACGDVFRSINPQTEAGRIFQDYSTKGQLVPDDVTIQLWQDYIRKNESNQTFLPREQCLVLDGIPRNVRQAKLLESFIEVRMVFHLQCETKGDLVARIQKRALREKRHDDAQETVINQRLKIYEAEAQLLLKHYSFSQVYHIDALQPAPAIHSRIIACYRNSSYSQTLPSPQKLNKVPYESPSK
jgi:adenylate kinase